MTKDILQPPTLAEFGVTLHDQNLDNGTKIVLLHKPNSPVQISYSVLAGSQFDPVQKQGIAHFLEHMLMAGTKRYPTKEAIGECIEDLGRISVTTNYDVINFNVLVADPRDIQNALDLIKELLQQPQFDPGTFSSEKQSILREQQKYRIDTRYRKWNQFRELFFQGTYLARPIIGTPETVQGITLREIQDLHQSAFTSERATIVMGGNITFDDAVRRLNPALMLRHEGIAAFQPQYLPTRRLHPISVDYQKEQDEISFTLGFRTPELHHPDNNALTLAAYIASHGRTSRLVRLLRQELGLVYSINASVTRYPEAGTWHISSATSRETLQDVLDRITEELNLLKVSPPSEDEIIFAKRKVVTNARLNAQTIQHIVNEHDPYAIHRRHTGETIATTEENIRRTLGLEPNDIQRVSQKYFTSDNWYLALNGNISTDSINFQL